MFIPCCDIAVAATASAAPTVSWNGVTLGAPAAALRSSFGDPVRLVVLDNGSTPVARYWPPGNDATYFLVVEKSGYIDRFEIFSHTPPAAILANVPPDPFGVRLGDSMENVQREHSNLRSGTSPQGMPVLLGNSGNAANVIYSFENDRLESILWVNQATDNRRAVTGLTLPAGDSFKTAIADVAKNESDGVAWEYRFLSFNPCAENSAWKLQSQALASQGGRAYDVLHVVCPATNQKRDFYFDITSYFGKL